MTTITCDGCGQQILRRNDFKQRQSHLMLGDLKIEVTVEKKEGSKSDFCFYCIMAALSQLNDRPTT